MLESLVGGAVDGLRSEMVVAQAALNKDLAVIQAEIIELRMKLFGPAKVSCNGDAEEEKVTVDPLLPPAQAVAIHAHAR